MNGSIVATRPRSVTVTRSAAPWLRSSSSMPPPTRVLVTGATGFLGHNLVTQLAAAGYTVRALVRETSDTRHLRELGAELCTGDVREAAAVKAAVAGCDMVVHADLRTAKAREELRRIGTPR